MIKNKRKISKEKVWRKMKETKEQAEVKKENKTVNNSKMEKESIEKTLKSLQKRS